MKYLVYIARTDTFRCEVEADDEQGACDIATDVEMQGNGVCTHSDAEIIEVVEVGE